VLLPPLAIVVAIVGGTDDLGDPAVVDVTIAGGQCSGIVVAPRVVVTAAHCALPGVSLAAPGTVDFGARAPSAQTAAIVDIWIDRGYADDVDHDLAALRLDRDAPATLPIDLAIGIGDAVRLVGYGSSGVADSRGVRRMVSAVVTDVTERHLVVGDAGHTTCIGDSGGAAIDSAGGVVGIVSAGAIGCDAPAQLARPSSEPALAEVIAAWSGPCPADGTCTAGCADPDCDPCGFEGTCALACPSIDLDCPVGGGPGATCTTATDCESRSCVAAPEGADRGAFCSSACEVASDCPSPLDACDGGTCVYRGGTPGIAGAACRSDDDCRAQLCDVTAGVCTVPCGAHGACPAGLSCARVRDTRACTTTGCSTSGSAPGAGMLALGLAMWTRRRRRQ
jgi:MYXO-CTERM domain-containing protein